MVTAAQVRELALSLPRTTAGVVSDSVRFRIGRLVYAAFSRDEQSMGFAYPKEERAGLVAAEPDKFALPRPSQMRYNWVVCRLDRLDEAEMHELLVDAWRMCVPKKVAAEYLDR
ncbi:MmcQ/YjbR family DNA-binding protein [Pseudonocardia spinosispora]|uniref:MmcQ/YjbR family DNA-binding protein n=1 Tax=Pseudonocardia spinosispora TaxID=103441 RepID=UPI00040B39E6|nr:MmcQ/YjbR family DNA-binding protein [Pseudonocardia spinosispora]